jgi:hypothetical protein
VADPTPLPTRPEFMRMLDAYERAAYRYDRNDASEESCEALDRTRYALRDAWRDALDGLAALEAERDAREEVGYRRGFTAAREGSLVDAELGASLIRQRDDAHARASAAESRSAALEEALRGLITCNDDDDGPCFCDRWEGGRSTHSEWCLRARAALASSGTTRDE